MGTEAPSLTERELVELWRLGCFIDMGYDVDTAERLAGSEADLHRVASLLESGCSHELAAEIAR